MLISDAEEDGKAANVALSGCWQVEAAGCDEFERLQMFVYIQQCAKWKGERTKGTKQLSLIYRKSLESV